MTTIAPCGCPCKKEPHYGDGYLHDSMDDGPYDVDGLDYCGRCHHGLNDHAIVHSTTCPIRDGEALIARIRRQAKEIATLKARVEELETERRNNEHYHACQDSGIEALRCVCGYCAARRAAKGESE